MLKETVYFINETIVWNTPLIVLCLFVGLYFSVRTRFFQIRLIPAMLGSIFESKGSSRGISSFQSLAITLTGRIGVGNIAGTAIAVYYGGPGSIFWLWVISFLGAATSFVESVLAQLWKEEIDGEYRGGPAYYIEKGMGSSLYALIFAFVIVFSCGAFLPVVQSNVFTSAFYNVLGLPRFIIGGVLMTVLALIVCGGVKRIAYVSEILAPFMAIGYMLVAVYVISFHTEGLPLVLKQIVFSALSRDAVFGGIWGSAIIWGVKRGLFSNEAGQGTAPHMAAAAEVSHPAKQGLIQAFSVYINTILICTTTGLMILLTGCFNVIDERTGTIIINNLPGYEHGIAFAQAAVSSVFPRTGALIVALALGFFSFSTLMVHYYQAESNLAYIFKGDRFRLRAIKVLRFVFLFFVFFSSLWPGELAWALADIGVGLSYIINIFAVLILQQPAFWLLADYENQRKTNKDAVFDPRGCPFANTGLWLNINRKRI